MHIANNNFKEEVDVLNISNMGMQLFLADKKIKISEGALVDFNFNKNGNTVLGKGYVRWLDTKSQTFGLEFIPNHKDDENIRLAELVNELKLNQITGA